MTHKILPERPRYFLTDGGIETTLIFDEGFDLPHFAAFTLLESDEGRAALNAYFERYIGIAKSVGWGFILELATWRASADWGDLLGYSPESLAELNRLAISQLRELKSRHATARSPMLISGCVGPRGDGYDPGKVMESLEAEVYHCAQITAFAAAGADMVTAITMTNTPEAIGVSRAATSQGLPHVISFTVETDGCLPTGQSLADAISEADDATGNGPAYYMINCAHPTHFRAQLDADADWCRRIGGMRVNASCKSHAELNESETLDRGDRHDLGNRNAELCRSFPSIRVLGGCCGTDHTHIDAIAHAVSAEIANAG